MRATFGNIDIYLFDQLLKGRFEHCQKILDAGCGGGRNLVYFLQQGIDVYGIDQNEIAIQELRLLAQHLAPQIPPQNFQVASIEQMPYAEHSFDLVICNAVLHFARDKAHFEAMLFALWKVLRKEGYLFIRLASSIGIEDKLIVLGDGQYRLPDDSDRFLVSEADLLDYTQKLNGELFEYIKTTNVQGLRCMTTWCLQKK